MPKYEYACKSCGEHLEVVQAFTDDALTECPACGGRLRKVFGNIGVVLKGSGFYKTDNRSSSSGRPRGSESGESGKEEKGETAEKSSSDSKSSDKSDKSEKSGSGSKSAESAGSSSGGSSSGGSANGSSGDSKPKPKADTAAKSS